MDITVTLTGDELEFQRKAHTTYDKDGEVLNSPTDEELAEILAKRHKHFLTRDYQASLNSEWNKFSIEEKKAKLK